MRLAEAKAIAMGVNISRFENPEYMTVFDFERFEYEYVLVFLNKNPFFAIYASVIYLSAIYWGQKYMLGREKYNVKNLLKTWNFFLATLSILMFLRMLPELVQEVKEYGMYSSFCHFKKLNIVTTFWGTVFAFSKFLEFGDTFFLIASKKPVRLLHWYHHVSVACYCFPFTVSPDPLARWFSLINSFVHSIMYTYYGLTSMGYKIPKVASMSLTLLQISQMVFGLYANVVTYNYKDGDIACNRPYWSCPLTFGLYASYLVLFSNFFYHAYLKGDSSVKKKLT